ncbi:uncharacterized protein C8Q71DRAFT_723846 [Rhodofomes roseus]|uniref:DUF6533 domain-containing protein n=1 Tax=Rhodofomes roseus TaxID=34475 RepID=A0ABQ8KG55_9APHY|nr:uncharacterized protein C8Q71DRAFT_723846 [Rhodofomes roseus]KAH9836759.1 hypothetical protein C8Q71DRAFT_723846 [Rhodofomes roseus]
MSTDELTETIAVVNVTFIINCCDIAACAIYTYDRILTFWREVDLIWQRRSMSVATVFHIAVGVFQALRAFAISNRSVPLAFAIFLLSVVISAMDVYEIFTVVPVPLPDPVGCMLFVSGSSYSTLRLATVLIASQTSAIVAEVLLVVATWRQVYRAKFAEDPHFKTPVTTVFLRYGIVYFITLLVLLVVNMALSETIISNGIVSPILTALQMSLLSHFYLSLHEAILVEIPSGASEISDLIFTRMVGSLAGSLLYGTRSRLDHGVDVEDVISSSKKEAEDGRAMDIEQSAVLATGGDGAALNSEVFIDEVPRIASVAV